MNACVPAMTDKNGDIICEGGTWVLQTISEIVARSSVTVEIFSGTAALSLVCIYVVIQDIMAHADITTKHIVIIAYTLGAVGYVGLTVWSLRVSGPIHTCFTAQTLTMMMMQTFILTANPPPGADYDWFSAALVLCQLVALVAYIWLYSNVPLHDWSSIKGYYDVSRYQHAWAQYSFVVLYYITLGYMNETIKEGKGGSTLTDDHVPLATIVGLRSRRRYTRLSL